MHPKLNENFNGNRLKPLQSLAWEGLDKNFHASGVLGKRFKRNSFSKEKFVICASRPHFHIPKEASSWVFSELNFMLSGTLKNPSLRFHVDHSISLICKTLDDLAGSFVSDERGVNLHHHHAGAVLGGEI